MNRRTTAIVAVISVVLAATLQFTGGPSAQAAGVDDSVHLNEIQTIGSHNSYHLLPTPAENELRHSLIGDGDQGLTYQADPLPMQFQNDKVRQIELDVWLDQAGGRYAAPLLRSAAGEGAYDPAMNAPGIKVFHVQDVDYHSSCLTLVACLQQVKGWSDAHPTHVPIAILLELKDEEVPFPGFPFVLPEPWTTAGENSLDAEIRTVFDPSQLITPDDVRGSHASLSDAVTSDGWPTLGESRGKVMFLMDNGGHYRTDYLADGHGALQDRVLFTNASPGAADAGFIERNDPTDASIPSLVEQGYVVRTRADADTRQARDNDTAMRDAALASGAQWVSTDYPRPGMAVGFTSPYFAEIPGGTVARCNPVNGPADCVASQLDTNDTPITTDTTTTTATPGSSTTLPGGSSTTVPKPKPTPGAAPRRSVSPATGARPRAGVASYTG